MENLEPSTSTKGPEDNKNFVSPSFDQADQVLKELEDDCLSQSNPLPPKKKKDNPFPLEAFPEKVQEIILATHESLLFPIDFTGTSMLCAAATAIGNSFTVTVKQGWQEGAVLYAALVAPPGANKSHPLTFAYAPLAKRDDETYHRYVQEKRAYDLVNEGSKKQKNSTPTGEEFQEPVLQKILMSDFTIEALTKVHHNNPRGVGVIADELVGFIKNLNRYNNGGDVEFYLSAWSIKTVSVDRASNKMPIRIKRPFIPVIGTIQNKVLLELATKGKSDNGFLDRFIFAMPKGIKKERWSEASLDESHIREWSLQISNLLELKLELDEWGAPKSRDLRFSSAAWVKLKAWQAKNTDLCNAAESEALKGVYTKLETYAIRFALILQLMAWACGEEKEAVEEKAVDGAIMLVEYFRNTAHEVQRIINKSPLDTLDQQKKRLYDKLPESFSTGEGLTLAEALGVPERTFKDFLNNEALFIRVQHGKYLKAD